MGALLAYALDENNILVHVDDVETGLKCNCTCPNCHAPLLAKNNGKVRQHHFAHADGHECEGAYESMLHLLAKKKISDAFISNSEFWIEFKYKSYCCKFQQCKYQRDKDCCTVERKRFDLKKYYDSCEQERAYDNVNRRSDLKIYSSSQPDREPVYLEFWVKHACDYDKLHSGNKIIEIYLEK